MIRLNSDGRSEWAAQTWDSKNMRAISSIKELFGPSGYRIYSAALGRCPTTFNRNVSDERTLTSRLVLTSCKILRSAKAAGLCPHMLLDQASRIYIPTTGRKSWLFTTFEEILGDAAIAQIAAHFDMSTEAVVRAINRDGARYEPHFRVMATAMVALKQKGRGVTLETFSTPEFTKQAA